MDQAYSNHNVRFRYPGEWELSERERPGEVSISLDSPETSFWSLTLYFDRPDPQTLMQQALDVFRDEYDELDVYEAASLPDDPPGFACDVEFVCLDLLNGAFLRAFRTRQFTALVLYQGTDRELEETRGILEEISTSLEWDDELL